MSEMVRAEMYYRANKPVPPTPALTTSDPVLAEALWEGSAEQVADRFGVSRRTIVRWRNGHSRPYAEVDWSAVQRQRRDREAELRSSA